MKPEDLLKAPKIFCENIRIGYAQDYFVIGLSSGQQATVYSLTPEHAKRLLQYLTHEVGKYETEHGAITAVWNPNVVSPIQKTTPPPPES